MGQLYSAPEQEPSHESVINLSDALLYRLTDEDREKFGEKVKDVSQEHDLDHESLGENPLAHEKEKHHHHPGHHEHRKHNLFDELPRDVKERKQMHDLKIKDEVHSLTYGITVKHFEELLKKVNDLTEPIEEICPTHELMHCMKHNQHCMIHCKHAMDHFIECTDAYRINLIKELMECEEEERKKLLKQNEDDDIMAFLKDLETEGDEQ